MKLLTGFRYGGHSFDRCCCMLDRWVQLTKRLHCVCITLNKMLMLNMFYHELLWIVGGVTLHSFCGIGAGDAGLQRCIDLACRPASAQAWRKCKRLIIDEISMVDGEYFEVSVHFLDDSGRLLFIFWENIMSKNITYWWIELNWIKLNVLSENRSRST